MIRRLLNSQNGFTLLQSLVAVALTSGAALMGARVLETLNQGQKMVEKRGAINAVMNEIQTHLQSKAVCAANLNNALLNKPHNGLSNYDSNFLSVSVDEFYGAQGRVVISKNDTVGTQELFGIQDIQIRLNKVSAASDAAYTHSAAGQVLVTFQTCRKGLKTCENSKKLSINKTAPLPNVNLVADSTVFTSFDCASGQDGLLDQANLDTNDKLQNLVDVLNSSFQSMESDYITKLNEAREQLCDLKAQQMQIDGLSGTVDATNCGSMSISIVTKDLVSLTENTGGRDVIKILPETMIPGSLIVSMIAAGGGGGGGDRDEPGKGGQPGDALANFSMPTVKPGDNCKYRTGVGGSSGDGAASAKSGGKGGNTQLNCGGLYKVVTGGAGGAGEKHSGQNGQKGFDGWLGGIQYLGGAGGPRRGNGKVGAYGAGGGGGGDRWGEGGIGGRGALWIRYQESNITGSYVPITEGSYQEITLSDLTGTDANVTAELTPDQSSEPLLDQVTQLVEPDKDDAIDPSKELVPVAQTEPNVYEVSYEQEMQYVESSGDESLPVDAKSEQPDFWTY